MLEKFKAMFDKDNVSAIKQAENMRWYYNASMIEKDDAIKNMWSAFDRAADDYGRARIARMIKSVQVSW